MLARHRANYNALGPAPKCLQLLWWEFPQSQWDEIRDGGSMNFLKEPKHQITPNAPMSEDELAVAGEFVDELIALGVLREPIDDSGVPIDIVTNAPLFTVPKPGQPGQYRCIADMLKGGQNDVVGNDPVILPRAPHILDEMYHGGFAQFAPEEMRFVLVVDIPRQLHRLSNPRPSSCTTSLRARQLGGYSFRPICQLACFRRRTRACVGW